MKHKDIDEAMASKERAELYFAAHPGSPAAVRRPELSIRSGTWVALLGRGTEDAIVGVGSTAETAFRAFDAQYLTALRLSVDRAALNAGSAVPPKRVAWYKPKSMKGNNDHPERRRNGRHVASARPQSASRSRAGAIDPEMVKYYHAKKLE